MGGFCFMQQFMESLADINKVIYDFVWVKVGLVLLIATGILTTILTRFFQVSHFGHWMKETIGKLFKKDSHSSSKGSISQFQALCTALAATVGVGNIAGVADAIVIGGPGAVFWMWLAAFFGMMTNYSENVLGIYFRRKNKDGEWSGGAMYYLRDGLGGYKFKSKTLTSIIKWVGKVLAVFFSIFCLLASLGIGNMGQVDKIIANIESAFNIKALSNQVIYSSGNESVTLYSVIIGLSLMAIAALIILGGLKRIAAFAERVVPFMVIAFVVGSLTVIGFNYVNIGAAFKTIFVSAFSPKAVFGATTGIIVKEAITAGFKRGVFSNEAGLGSSVMVHSNSNVKEPVKQGMWGIFEVFADTMVVCTMTALVVLTSGVYDLGTGKLVDSSMSGSTLVAEAFNKLFTFGDVKVGGMFIAVAILLFAFTTILGWSHYGTKAWEFLFGTKSTVIYKTFFVLMILSGALMTSSLAWDISDTFNGLMMVPNLIGVISLSGLVVKITKNYIDRKMRKKDIKPILSFDQNTQNEQEAELILEEASV